MKYIYFSLLISTILKTHQERNFLAESILIICFFVVVFVVTELKASSENRKRDKEKRIAREKLEEYNKRKVAEQKAEEDRQEAERLKAEEEKLEQERLFQEKLDESKKNNPAHYIKLKLSSLGFSVETIISNEILGIEADLPSKDVVRRNNILNYLKTDGSVKAQLDRDLPKLYENNLYSICLNTIYNAFIVDDIGVAKSLIYNGFVLDYNPITGNLERNLILSIFIDKETFSKINIEHVDPRKCFKALKGISAAKLIDLVPVQPILQIDKTDHRFIDSKDILTNQGTNLALIPWEDFEQLVREIFELEFSKNGGEVHVTQSSRDGGVDAIIFDPDPLRGGKIVIQAKRYTNTVPVAAIRDLYGTVINEGANSGIIITTSDYGRDSYEFAKDKPLKLLNGGHLLALLKKNGRKGYINLSEAKEIIRASDQG